jgi:hypothetical protein
MSQENRGFGKDETGRNVLHRALFEKRWNDVPGLIEQNPGILDDTSNTRWSPLMLGVYMGAPLATVILLLEGFDIKKYHSEWLRDPKSFDFFYGINLLTSAIKGGDKEVVNKILSLYVRLGPSSLDEVINGYYSAKAMLSTISFAHTAEKTSELESIVGLGRIDSLFYTPETKWCILLSLKNFIPIEMVGSVTKYLGFVDIPVPLEGRELKGLLSEGAFSTTCLGSGSQACDDDGDDSSCLFLEQFVYGARPLTSEDLEAFVK